MAPKFPRITPHGFTAGKDGAEPVFVEHRRVDGWRNRHLRREGKGDEVVHGKLRGTGSKRLEDPLAAIALSQDDYELWVFNHGHLYEASVDVDGAVHAVLVDAREQHAQHTFSPSMELLEVRALNEDEVAAHDDELESARDDLRLAELHALGREYTDDEESEAREILDRVAERVAIRIAALESLDDLEPDAAAELERLRGFRDELISAHEDEGSASGE